jgi:cell division protein FtsZ
LPPDPVLIVRDIYTPPLPCPADRDRIRWAFLLTVPLGRDTMSEDIEDILSRLRREGEAREPEDASLLGPSEGVDDELESVLRQTMAEILVVGVGGAGGNTVTRLLDIGLQDVESVVMNTDAQALVYADASRKMLLGRETTGGMGAGNNPEVGEQSAIEAIPAIKDLVHGKDLVFVTCGLGGGTGTGAIPVVAKEAKDAGALTVAVVTFPFKMEGKVRTENSKIGLSKLLGWCDSVIVVPNDKLLELAPGVPINTAFKISDEVLLKIIVGMSELIVKPGLVNLDLADLRKILKGSGAALIGLGEASGREKAMKAAMDVLNSPLLDVDISNGRGAIVNVVSSMDVTLMDVEKIVKMVGEKLNPKAEIIWGAQIDEEMKDTVRVLIVISGLKLSEKFVAPVAGAQEGEEGEMPVPDVKELFRGISTVGWSGSRA